MYNIVNHTRFYMNDEYSDVNFLLKDRNGKDCRIPAHRFLLMSRSVVFERMFYGDMKEGRNVKITDVSAEAFIEFLQFFYSVGVVLTSQNIGQVLKLIDKYDTPGLWSVCEKFMEQSVTEALAFEYYELALSFNLSSEISGKFLNMLCRNRKLVFDINNVRYYNRIALSNILKSNELEGEEIDIFRDVMAWVKASLEQRNKAISKENLKEELGDLVQYIRFPIMRSEELLGCLKEYPSLLPPEVLLELISYVFHKTPLIVAAKFSTEARVCNRMYNISFTKSSQATFLSTGTLQLNWNSPTPRKYLVELLIDYNGYPECSIIVSKNGYQVGNAVSLYMNGSIQSRKLALSISLDRQGDYFSIFINYNNGPNCVYARTGVAEQNLPDGLVITNTQCHTVSELCLKEIR